MSRKNVQRCGARTRRGTACLRPAVENPRTGKRVRCRNHGGLSTGPKRKSFEEHVDEALVQLEKFRRLTSVHVGGESPDGDPVMSENNTKMNQSEVEIKWDPETPLAKWMKSDKKAARLLANSLGMQMNHLHRISELGGSTTAARAQDIAESIKSMEDTKHYPVPAESMMREEAMERFFACHERGEEYRRYYTTYMDLPPSKKKEIKVRLGKKFGTTSWISATWRDRHGIGEARRVASMFMEVPNEAPTYDSNVENLFSGLSADEVDYASEVASFALNGDGHRAAVEEAVAFVTSDDEMRNFYGKCHESEHVIIRLMSVRRDSKQWELVHTSIQRFIVDQVWDDPRVLEAAKAVMMERLLGDRKAAE